MSSSSVKKIQVVKSLTETTAHEAETVTLEVELSHTDVDGSWTKDGVKVKSGGNCRITVLGKKHALTLSNLKMEDAGNFVFQADGVRVSGKLIVLGKTCMYCSHFGFCFLAFFSHSVTIVCTEPPAMISKPIMDISVPEKEKVTFECEVSRTNIEVKWLKVRQHDGNY